MRIAVVPVEATGHLTPMLEVLRHLARRADVARVQVLASGGTSPASTASPASVGAEHVVPPVTRTVPERPADLAPLAYSCSVAPLAWLDGLVAAARDFAPDVVLHDVFALGGVLAAAATGAPRVALVPLPGYGALGESFATDHGLGHPLLAEASREYRRLTGCAPPAESGCAALFPSPRCSLMTTIPALSCPVEPATTPRLHGLLRGHLGGVRLVGPCSPHLPPRHVPPVLPALATADPDLDRELARQGARRVVVCSVGTVLTDRRYDSPVGGAATGREFLTRLLGGLLDAFGGDPDHCLVVATGRRLPPEPLGPWPPNVIVREHLPLAALLGRADVFVTHHGLSSTAEALLAGVPMVAVPGVGDQIVMARMLRGHGASTACWDLDAVAPGLTAARLRAAVTVAATDPAVRRACARLRALTIRHGDASGAARLVVDAAG